MCKQIQSHRFIFTEDMRLVLKGTIFINVYPDRTNFSLLRVFNLKKNLQTDQPKTFTTFAYNMYEHAIPISKLTLHNYGRYATRIKGYQSNKKYIFQAISDA